MLNERNTLADAQTTARLLTPWVGVGDGGDARWDGRVSCVEMPSRPCSVPVSRTYTWAPHMPVQRTMTKNGEHPAEKRRDRL